MAGDTRDPSTPTPRGPPPGSTEPPEHVKTPPKIYEVFNAPPPSANALPEGSGLNTAGAREKQPTLTEGIKTVRLQDFKQVHMYPCVRESLLMGIGSAFGVGGVRALWGGKEPNTYLSMLGIWILNVGWDLLTGRYSAYTESC
jgi:cytochrome c oxidase assembly protein subunit 20